MNARCPAAGLVASLMVLAACGTTLEVADSPPAAEVESPSVETVAVSAEADVGPMEAVEADAEPPGATDEAALARCQRIGTEVERREAAGLVDDDEFEEVELSEEELEQRTIEPLPMEAAVLAPGERPTFATMPDELDVTALDNDGLYRALESCLESGVLGEEGDADMAEFCQELAGLSAEEVAQWATEEGDEIVDEEFGYCDLPRPDR